MLLLKWNGYFPCHTNRVDENIEFFWYRQLKCAMQLKQYQRSVTLIFCVSFHYTIRIWNRIGQSDKHDSVVKCHCSFHSSVVLMAVQIMFGFSYSLCSIFFKFFDTVFLSFKPISAYKTMKWMHSFVGVAIAVLWLHSDWLLFAGKKFYRRIIDTLFFYEYGHDVWNQS